MSFDYIAFWDGVEGLNYQHNLVRAIVEDFDDGNAYIAFLSVEQKGRGRGNAYMLDLTNLADRCSYTLALHVDGQNADRLETWYKRLGFAWGQSTDYMERLPTVECFKRAA